MGNRDNPGYMSERQLRITIGEAKRTIEVATKNIASAEERIEACTAEQERRKQNLIDNPPPPEKPYVTRKSKGGKGVSQVNR